MELDRDDLDLLRASGVAMMDRLKAAAADSPPKKTPPADAPIALEPPGYEDAGVYEIDELAAIRLGLTHRLDLQVRLGEVYDAQRNVVVKADALRGRADLSWVGAIG